MFFENMENDTKHTLKMNIKIKFHVTNLPMFMNEVPRVH